MAVFFISKIYKKPLKRLRGFKEYLSKIFIPDSRVFADCLVNIGDSLFNIRNCLIKLFCPTQIIDKNLEIDNRIGIFHYRFDFKI